MENKISRRHTTPTARYTQRMRAVLFQDDSANVRIRVLSVLKTLANYSLVAHWQSKQRRVHYSLRNERRQTERMQRRYYLYKMFVFLEQDLSLCFSQVEKRKRTARCFMICTSTRLRIRRVLLIINQFNFSGRRTVHQLRSMAGVCAQSRYKKAAQMWFGS